MMDWNNTCSDQRIVEWRSLRKEITTLSLEDKLNRISIFFKSIPLGKRCIDYYNPETWPSPWEILSEGMFCKNTAGLLIYHTVYIVLDESFRNNISLCLIEDSQDRYLVTIFDNKYVINYYLGEVVLFDEMKKDFKIIETFDTQIPKII